MNRFSRAQQDHTAGDSGTAPPSQDILKFDQLQGRSEAIWSRY